MSWSVSPTMSLMAQKSEALYCVQLPMPTIDASVMFSAAFMCLSVCLFVFAQDISKTDAARISKCDKKLFHHKSWKSIYLGVKRSKVKVKRHKNIAGVFCTLVSAGFF